MENPQNSLVALHDRWVWLLNTLLRFGIQAHHSCYKYMCFSHFPSWFLLLSLPCQVFKVSFWMRKHAALTWKRTWVWCTSDIIQRLDLGPLNTEERVCQVKTTKQWVCPKTGKKKFQGNRNLKGTQ